jgi:hypothetical protein
MPEAPPVLAVDLALKHLRDFGVALVSRVGLHLEANLLRWHSKTTPTVREVADRILQVTERHAVNIILLDGTQAWKDEDNGLVHCRVCEKEMHTPSKTGPPGLCKPANYLAFTEFSIGIFDALAAAGFPRLAVDPAQHHGRACIETFPFRAWRNLGLAPLPSKARATAEDIATRRAWLADRFDLRCEAEPSHDELQALVSSLAGVALQDRRTDRLAWAGTPPFRKAGTMREGLLVIPKASSQPD